jgi:hypothetical protein
MKSRFYFQFPALIILSIILTSCNSTTSFDIEKILNPGELPFLKSSKLIEVSSHDSSGKNNDRLVIQSGKTATILNTAGPGIITRIWFTVDSKDPYFLRRILLRMYWDEEEYPSVEVPLGDFFGCGFDYKQYSTPYLGMTGGGFTCFFPMPFERKAKIDIVNETGLEIDGFYYQINYQKLEYPISTDVAYFHTFWHRDVRTNYDSNYTILKTTGKGHVVGVNMNIQSYDGTFSFLDGTERVFVDREMKPSMYGTATEDYFSSGWNFNRGEYAGPYNGLILKNDSLSRIAAYRFHISDAIPFKKSIYFSFEHGKGNRDVADYSSTVYWYQLEPHQKFPPIAKAGQRIPLRTVTPIRILEAENLKFNLGGIRSKVIDMSENGPEWSGLKQMIIESKNSDTFLLNLPKLEELSYTINIYYSQAPNFGNIGIFIGDEKVGEIKGYAPFVKPGGNIVLTDISNPGKGLVLKFVVEDKEFESAGYWLGLDGIKMIPQRNYFPDWMILGPFPNSRISENIRLGMDSIYPPEKNIDITATYLGINSQAIHWQHIQSPPNGYVSLHAFLKPNKRIISYALTYLYSGEDRIVNLLLGSDDGLKVFFNERQIFRYIGSRIAEPDQSQVFLHVHKGWNKLLLKIENSYDVYGFYARILDRERSIIFSSTKTLPDTVNSKVKKTKKSK